MTKEQIIKRFENLYNRLEEYAKDDTPAVMDTFFCIIETIATSENIDINEIKKYCKKFEFKNDRIVGYKYV